MYSFPFPKKSVETYYLCNVKADAVSQKQWGNLSYGHIVTILYHITLYVMLIIVVIKK